MILTTDRIAILWCILFCFQIIVVAIFVLIFFAFRLLYNVHLIYFKGLFNHQMTVFVKPLNDFWPHDSVSSWNVRFRPFRVSLISTMRSLQCEMFIYFYRKLSFFCFLSVCRLLSAFLLLHYHRIYFSILACWSRRCEANANEIPFDWIGCACVG